MVKPLKLDKVALRCSKLPLFKMCAACVRPIRDTIIEEAADFNDPASLGDAVHAGLAFRVVTGEDADLSALATKHQVDRDDLEQMYRYGLKCWEQLAVHFGDTPIVEQAEFMEFDTFTLSGHPDLRSGNAVDGPGLVGDWKSGRVEYDCTWQIYGGGLLTGKQRGVVIWLRETWTGEPFEVIHLPDEDFIIEQLSEQVEQIHNKPTPGPHCNVMYCPRRHECDAYKRRVRQSIGALTKAAKPGEILDPAKLVEVYDALKPAKAAIKGVESYLNEYLDTHGELDLGDGRKLVRLIQSRKQFDTVKTLAVMDEYGVTEPDKCFNIETGPLEKTIKNLAEGAGAKKGAYYSEFIDRCVEVGAVTYKETRTRKEIRS